MIKKNFLISKENIALNDCRDKVKIFNEAISTINSYDYFNPISLNSYKTKKNFLSKKVKSSDLETILKKYFDSYLEGYYKYSNKGDLRMSEYKMFCST